MKTVPKICPVCNKEFKALLKEHNRGNANFCSISCSSRRRKKVHEDNVSCALCNKSFYIIPSKLQNSKSGLYFCCREHKDQAQRIGGIKEIQPTHYNNGIHNYRAIAFRCLPNECCRCGYKKHPQVLHIHHIDKNRSNNVIENLQIMCPLCHEELHFFDRSGRWSC